MRHNGRPALFVSRLAPNLVSLSEKGCPLVGCPDCGVWRSVKRSMITPHRVEVPGEDAWPAELRPERPWCSGSGQRVKVDLAVAEWRQRLAEGVFEAGQRRGTRVSRRPKPPVAPAVHQMAAAR